MGVLNIGVAFINQTGLLKYYFNKSRKKSLTLIGAAKSVVDLPVLKITIKEDERCNIVI